MKKLLILIISATFLTACVSTPKLGNYANDPNGMWEQGKKYSEKGEKLIIKGEKTLEKSRTELREGEALIQIASDTIIRSRQSYQLESQQIGASTSPKEIQYEADRLTAIGDKWEDAIDDVKKGNSMITKSKKLQTEAQAMIKEGRELVETGSNFIRNSQRMRLELPLLTETKI